MNPPHSEFENDPESEPRALESGAHHSPASLRGEIFDLDLNLESEPEAQTRAQKTAATWFVAALASLFLVYNFGAYVGKKSVKPTFFTPTAASKEAKLPPLRVQIAGLVKKPGVYTLPGDARVEDALKKSGGAAPGADLRGFNLADWVADGSKIEVPRRQTVPNPQSVPTPAPTPTPIVIIKEVFITPPQNAPDGMVSGAPEVSPRSPFPKTAAKQTDASTDAAPRARRAGKSAPEMLALLRKNPIDLNRASAQQLSVLPGVGPKMAERILLYRRENGGFKSVADLDNVKGIGEKRMETLKDLVKVK